MRCRRSYSNLQNVARRHFSSSNTTAANNTTTKTHFVFGANTDLGKTVLTAALVRASAVDTTTAATHYIKPLQCGGSDEAFVRKHVSDHLSSTTTLFRWETPASPHFAARFENKPVSDQEVVTALTKSLDELQAKSNGSSIWVETAGGVMSPSSSSPQNNAPHHSKDAASGWGWVTQADLYAAFQDRSSVVLIGDGRLGGISSTLTALEALLNRNYNIGGILMIKDDDEAGDPNVQALREYAASYPKEMSSSSSLLFANPEQSIISLPTLPPEPEPLNEWYASSDVQGPMTSFVQDHLFQSYDKS